MKPLTDLNKGKSYADQIKPFNFLLSCHVKAFGHPLGVDPEQFHLISPYETDSSHWLKRRWIDQYSGKTYQITTTRDHGDRHTTRVKTYGDVLRDYEYHPESKCADARGKTSDKQTVGLLQRRQVQIESITAIGKDVHPSLYTRSCREWRDGPLNQCLRIPGARESVSPAASKLRCNWREIFHSGSSPHRCARIAITLATAHPAPSAAIVEVRRDEVVLPRSGLHACNQ